MLKDPELTLPVAEAKACRAEGLAQPGHVGEHGVHQLNASLELRPFERATLSTTVRYVGRRKAEVDNSLSSERPFLKRDTLGGFTVVNLAGTYQLADGIRLCGRIDNLLDRTYEDPMHWNSRGFSGYIGIRGTY